MSRQAGFAAILVLQAGYLGLTAAYHHLRVQSGTRVMLQTEPVDPMSMFRGRYVTLNYRISRLPAALLRDDAAGLRDGDPLYVVLERRGEFWEAASVHRQRPAGGVFLKGQLRTPPGKELSLRYGTETFFLSEASADAIEAQQRAVAQARWSRPRAEWKEALAPEDRRILDAKLDRFWLGKLNEEMPRWVAAGWLADEPMHLISQHYDGALTRLREAQQPREAAETPVMPLTVEVSAGTDGTGYPVRLFWEGREYR